MVLPETKYKLIPHHAMPQIQYTIFSTVCLLENPQGHSLIVVNFFTEVYFCFQKEKKINSLKVMCLVLTSLSYG